MHLYMDNQSNLVAKVVTKPEFLVTKKKMLVTLATVSVAIASPDYHSASSHFMHHLFACLVFVYVVTTLYAMHFTH